VLRKHPECFVPACKDLYFFDRFYDRGLPWYASFFADAPPTAKAVGELCHDYLFSVVVADRIAHDLPGVKLLTCLRDPIDRTHSHYLYMVRSGLTTRSFEEALDIYPELIDHSLYAKHLAPYFERFDRDHLHVLSFDRLRQDPLGFTAEVFAYLGLSLDHIPQEPPVLMASRPRSRWLALLMKAGAERARSLGLVNLVGVIKRSWVTRVLYGAYREGERPQIAPGTQVRLREVFEEDSRRLAELLQGDPGWVGTRS